MVDTGVMTAEEFFLAALKEYEGKAGGGGVKTPSAVYADPVGGIGEGAMMQRKKEGLIKKLGEFGCRCVDVDGDGDCQFSSISLLMFKTVTKKDIVRAKAVEELRSHPTQYSHYVHDVGFGEYCDLMSRSYTWGDHLTLQALANAFDTRFIVIAATDGVEEVTSFEISCPSAKSTYYLGFVQELHYLAAVEWPDEDGENRSTLQLTASRPVVPGPVELLAERCAEFGLRLLDIDAGTNSLFAAFGSLSESSAESCRIDAATELTNHPINYKHQHETGYESYVEQIKGSGAPGDQRVLRALCTHAHVQVTLVSLEGTKIITSTFGPANPRHRYYMGCYSGRQFRPIIQE